MAPEPYLSTEAPSHLATRNPAAALLRIVLRAPRMLIVTLEEVNGGNSPATSVTPLIVDDGLSASHHALLSLFR